LKTLTVGGNAVTLVADQLSYTVDLPSGTTTVPAVTATPTDSKATVVITPAADLQGQTTIVVTAEDGTTTQTYTVSFNVLKSTDATLQTLTVGGTELTLVPGQLDYTVDLPNGTTTVPAVIATATDSKATVVVTPATGLPGTTTIVVTAEDGSKITYTVKFNVLPNAIPGVNASKEVKAVMYYDLSGHPATVSTKGFVLVKTIYTDGTSSSAKLYNKDK
jgi:hypothetical protein